MLVSTLFSLLKCLLLKLGCFRVFQWATPGCLCLKMGGCSRWSSSCPWLPLCLLDIFVRTPGRLDCSHENDLVSSVTVMLTMLKRTLTPHVLALKVIGVLRECEKFADTLLTLFCLLFPSNGLRLISSGWKTPRHCLK